MEIYTGTDVSSNTVSGNATQIIHVIACDMAIHMRTIYKPTEPRNSSAYVWRKRSRQIEKGREEREALRTRMYDGCCAISKALEQVGANMLPRRTQ
jgi:hypothetical protein